MGRELKPEDMVGRIWYACRWRTPEQVETCKRNGKIIAERNRDKINANRRRIRSANRELSNAESRAQAKRNRSRLGDKAWRERNRRYCKLPLPTRPEPDICEICGKHSKTKYKSLHLDHDHANGKFRGWLCHSCNIGIGNFKDDPQLLLKAIGYLLVNSIHN